ncbi:MAG: hypothetical protein A3J07_01150 [Candidatus Doudnabacteria bacterium RIFCSPLOWO2_02_FULL_49_13]|uniref:Glycosyl transferase family 28 C-terminal domain-containing protein n=1 Tax=Candidatus Doudnabacteria bacterium RIFCSPHIGHO2_12_FULL_48_16 TaxID=1817838 RepID=A0A1F5PKF2_9BACT|nr:MAG: hypothetical protein A3B77_04080 [Candidatus Doudnabacteria bacterium RIFCSPHIGHO2_02_FULL_49_24]OGE88662.1 MAG: hypothetical protein A2760_01740 [Candidatus Doudnabacteria bacterium RIFCSPHIGHO2_01_FULL_50_67]OGE90347.1 MAG: hypothetical protein A3E29_04660 [Candidatus Doudnabacteria bacterium RIFCSPHIGHO2_12_FULL_48_16]OGE97054.1 MAG: hypothetical protein A2990_01650 [Candidatus Doudnabacteria bacterium RIFCSPLOWO2_01_FULL_49_40]OGF02403.1 MAG: hypothetical protein A3J07_01150 [Candid
MKTKILVLCTSVGGGIKSTADNVAEQLNLSGRYETRVEDVEKVERGVVTSIIRSGTVGMLNHMPWLWGFLYDAQIILSLSLPLRKVLASFKSKHVLELLRSWQPAIVISTGVNPSAIMAYLKSKGLYRGKFVTVFSDYHVQRFWLHRETDLFVCNVPEQISELKRLGYGEVPAVLTGTLIAQKFHRPLSRDLARDQLGLLKSMPLVLVGGAGKTRSSMREVFHQLLRSSQSFQVVALCGSNQTLKEELAQISAPDRHPVKILGFIGNMDVWMAASEVLVYKTGGPSMAEAVAKKLPIVFVDVRPGHEQKNLEYLTDHGIGVYARSPREAQHWVEEILAHRLKFNHEKSFQTIVRPPGAIALIEAIDRLHPKD